MNDHKIRDEAWLINPLDEVMDMENILENLVSWAILAANTHNVQPWKFNIYPKENQIDVCVDGEFVLPQSDKNGRQAVISVGCAIQNMLIAAEYYNLRYEINYAPDMLIYPKPIASIRFDKNPIKNPGDAKFMDAIKSRSMNRHQYDPIRPIPENVLEQIKEVARQNDLAINIITDMPTIIAIAEFQHGADQWVIMRTPFRSELARFFLLNKSDSRRGMPGYTFGLSDRTTIDISKELNKTGLANPVNSGKMAGFSKSGRDGIMSSPAIFVISVKKDVHQRWLAAGMAFQDVVLIAEMNGLSVSVHAATIEVALFNRLLKLRLGCEGRPTMLFRMGYAREKMPHSPRITSKEVGEIHK